MALRRLLLAALALCLPLVGLAQTAAPAAPAAAAAAPAAEAPKASDSVKVTPYGFLLANGYWTGNNLQNNDFPTQANAPNEGGAVLFSARQSRIGLKLSTVDDWSGATIDGVVEFDFNAGHVPGNPTCTLNTTTNVITCTQGQAASTAWYNGLMRLRLASMTASWKTGAGTVSVLAGQDVGIVNTLFAESLAWVANPIFWQAGNLWRRAPQFRLTWANSFGAVGANVAVAALSPATSTAGSPAGAVDFGAGNQSRVPNIEARLGLTAKAGDISGALGLGYHTNKRRIGYGTATQKDITGTLFGVDLDLGLTKYAQVKGEYYNGKGADDTYNGIGAPTTGTGLATEALKSNGMWAQAILKPLPAIWVTGGFGQAEADEAQSAAGARIKNAQVEGGVLVNAGKFWRFGLEYAQVTSTYKAATAGGANTEQKATQLALSSMLKF